MSISLKAKKELVERLLQVSFLTDREKDILKMRLGIGEYSATTLQEIGNKYGITRERVRQIGSSIVRRIKKNMPEEDIVAGTLFSKSWTPKYLVKKQHAARRKAASRRKKFIIKNKYKNLVDFITEFSRTGRGKERIDQLFKELRISYRRNKSLFDPYLVAELKQWRRRYIEMKQRGIEKKPDISMGPTDQGQIS